MTHPTTPPKSEHVEADVSRERVVSEQMWAVVSRLGPINDWRLLSLVFHTPGAAKIHAARMRVHGFETKAVSGRFTVDPGQLEEQSDG